MFSLKHSQILPRSVVAVSLFALAACGGGDDSRPTTIAADPAPQPVTPAPTAAPAPAPTPAPTPAPAPAPPTDPAPPVQITLASSYTQLRDAQGLSEPFWPEWSHVGRTAVDGVACARTEAYHKHAMVSIYRNGTRLALPSSIGRALCHYEMHTHDGSGIVHIEADAPKSFTLGQFFSLWGQALSAAGAAGLPGTPAFYVIDNEKIVRFTGDPRTIVLDPQREVLIVTGTSPVQVPRFDWIHGGM